MTTVGFAGQSVERLAEDGTGLGRFEVGQPPASLAIDLPGGVLYVGTEVGSVARLPGDCSAAACIVEGVFGQGYLNADVQERRGIAVDSGNHRVYVSNLNGERIDYEKRKGEVDVFRPR